MTVHTRVVEPRRAAALARHYREQEGLSIAEIARRLGRSPATVKAYLYDPTGEKAREVKGLRRSTVPPATSAGSAAALSGQNVDAVPDAWTYTPGSNACGTKKVDPYPGVSSRPPRCSGPNGARLPAGSRRARICDGVYPS